MALFRTDTQDVAELTAQCIHYKDMYEQEEAKNKRLRKFFKYLYKEAEGYPMSPAHHDHFTDWLEKEWLKFDKEKDNG